MIARLSALTFLACGFAIAASADLAPVEAQELTVPSGQPVEFFETLLDRPAMGLTARFRFVAPELSDRVAAMTYETLEADLAYLCETYALPRLGMPEPVMVVISLSSAAVPFGEPAPDVTQVFEAYRPSGDVCEWEAF